MHPRTRTQIENPHSKGNEVKLTTQQLAAMGYVETDTPGIWRKPSEFWKPSQTHAKAPQNDSVVVGATKPPKRIRQSTKPLMNRLELEWYDNLKVRFQILVSQSLRFKLGNGIWYKPDFVAWPSGFESQDTRMRAFEVKGPYSFRGGFENLKVAAHQYPQIKWTLVWKEGGQWKEQVVLP